MQTNHDHKKAIETAKKEFRRNPGPDSRRALFSAYIARIDELEKRGELTAASELKDSLSSRFPEHKDELLQLFFSYKAGAGSPFENALIAFLNDSPDSPSYRSSVENLGSIIVNPEQLSLSTLLPADHALKCQAQTLMRAFSAVTTHGNGADLQLLHELKSTIDRHSPLFAWRRATMALYAFYCGETAEMQKHLAGIDSRQPVGAIATALNSLAGVAPFPAEHPSYAGFAGLEKELNATLPPELREQLDQIFASAEQETWPPMNHATRALFRAVKKRSEAAFNSLARLWLTCISRFEQDEDCENPLPLMTEFGVPYKKSMIWLAASHVGRFDLDAAQTLANIALIQHNSTPFTTRQLGWMMYMAARLALQDKFLDLQYEYGRTITCEKLLKMAKTAWPGAPVYPLRLEIMHATGCATTKIESELLQWHKESPQNIEPLLELFLMACYRKAYKKAQSYIDIAEGIEPLHPSVRSGKAKILFKILLERFENRMARSPIEKEVLAFARLFAAGDPRSYIVWLFEEARIAIPYGDTANRFTNLRPAHPTVAELLKRAGSSMAGKSTGEIPDINLENPRLFWLDLGKACAGMQQVGIGLKLKQQFSDAMLLHIKHLDIEDDLLLPICDILSHNKLDQILFEASNVGIKRNTMLIYKYLFYRSMALTDTAPKRAAEVMRAARYFAKRANDNAFIELKLKQEKRDDDFDSLDGFSGGLMQMMGGSARHDVELSPEDATEILQTERKFDTWKPAKKQVNKRKQTKS